MEELKKCGCPDCEKRIQEDQTHEEASFAVFVSLVPLVVLTLFSVMNLL